MCWRLTRKKINSCVRKDPAGTIQWRQSFRGWRALRVTIFPFHDTTRTLKWNTSSYIFLSRYFIWLHKWKGFNDICVSLKYENEWLIYLFNSVNTLPAESRETISLRGPGFHRSHGHNLVRPGRQSEVIMVMYLRFAVNAHVHNHRHG